MGDLSNPLTRIEGYLAGIAGVLEAVPEPPLTRIEEYLKACYDSISGVAQTAAENLAAEYDPEGTYTAGDYVTYEGVLYKALVDSAEPAGEWVSENWEKAQVIPEVANLSEWEAVPDENIDWKNIDVTTIYRWGKLFINKERTFINFLFVYIIGAKPSTGQKHIASLDISDYVTNLKTNALAYDKIECSYNTSNAGVNNNNRYSNVSVASGVVNEYGNVAIKINLASLPSTVASMAFQGNLMLPLIALEDYTPEG